MKKKDGFTLIELLVAGIVTAIFMGIAGLIVVRYSKISQQESDYNLLQNEITIIKTEVNSIVELANSNSSYTITIVDDKEINTNFDKSMKFKKYSYLYGENETEYVYLTTVKLEQSNDHLFYLYFYQDEKIIEKISYRLV